MKKMMKNSRIKYRYLPLSQLYVFKYKHLFTENKFKKFYPNFLFPIKDQYIIYPLVVKKKDSTIEVSSFLFDPVAFGYLEEGRMYLKACEFDKALSLFKKAIEKSDTLYPALTGIGHCYFFQGEHSKAIKYYNKALKINPNDYRLYYFKGKTFLRLNKYENAINEFINSLILCPRYIYTYEILKEWKEELNPTFPRVVANSIFYTTDI